MILFLDFRSFSHHLSFLFICYHGILRPQAIPIDGSLIPSRVQNFRARYDHSMDAIYIQWSYPEQLQREVQPEFVVRYRITNRRDGFSEHDYDWKYSQVGTKLEAKLDLGEVRNGDELQAQVRVDHPDGTALEDWSQSLLISITKRVLIDGVAATDDDLLPPLDFQAHVLSTSMVRLEWSPPLRASLNVPASYYYIVNVKQLTSEDKTALLRQQVKVQANSFTLSNLKPGQRYELTIRTASSPERVSTVAAIVEITMPREDEFFEVGNLIISSHFKGPDQGTVNLTWEVSEKMQNLIQAYDLEYSEAGTEDWHHLQFSGSHPSASLTTLKSDTEYLLKIRTHLANNLTTESGQFRFRTPAIVKNPIKKVDVIFMHETDDIRLQWTLERPYSNLIHSYDVYVTDNPDLPDAEWLYYPANVSELSNNAFGSGDGSIVLHNLHHGHTYYVRINVRKKDGEVLRSPSIYRFKTMDSKTAHWSTERTKFLEHREGNTLSYQLLSPERVQITWTYPSSILSFITGSSIMYAESNSLPAKQWERINLQNPQQNSVVLEKLKPNSHYFVRILPQINNTFYDSNVIDIFEIRTGPKNYMQFSYPEDTNSRMLLQQQGSMMTGWGNEKLILNACNPDSMKNECLWDERCVPITEGHFRGLCIPGPLRNAIMNN